MVAVAPYSPQVVCGDARHRAPPAETCRPILDLMPVSTAMQYFGRAGQPGVEVPLPKGFTTGKFPVALHKSEKKDPDISPHTLGCSYTIQKSEDVLSRSRLKHGAILAIGGNYGSPQ